MVDYRNFLKPQTSVWLVSDAYYLGKRKAKSGKEFYKLCVLFYRRLHETNELVCRWRELTIMTDKTTYEFQVFWKGLYKEFIETGSEQICFDEIMPAVVDDIRKNQFNADIRWFRPYGDGAIPESKKIKTDNIGYMKLCPKTFIRRSSDMVWPEKALKRNPELRIRNSKIASASEKDVLEVNEFYEKGVI
jgi:hypothetical protein